MKPLAPPSSPAARLVAWQRRSGRHDLPWQGSRDPYRIWLSEVMLQQTQVATVRRYYLRFLERFPDAAALAAAPLDDVLALWSGLGYYRRARLLHQGAQTLMHAHGGRFPTTAAGLQTLPGIGRSTAAAIAAFCFDERVSILDGNVKRVLSRLLAFDEDLARAAAEKRLWQRADALLPQAADMPAYTQGLMDLGATVCTPRAPQCLICPWSADCRALAEGRPEDFPVKTRTLKRGERRQPLLWLVHGAQVLLRRRPPQGVWAGLWSLPMADDDEAAEAMLAGVAGRLERLPTFLHRLTHFDWHLSPLRLVLPQRQAPADLQALAERLRAASAPEDAPEDWRWIDRREALALALPAPVRSLLAG